MSMKTLKTVALQLEKCQIETYSRYHNVPRAIAQAAVDRPTEIGKGTQGVYY